MLLPTKRFRERQKDGSLPKLTKPRSSKDLNNVIEQDHRGIKSRSRPMLGFKSFVSATNTIAGWSFYAASTNSTLC